MRCALSNQKTVASVSDLIHRPDLRRFGHRARLARYKRRHRSTRTPLGLTGAQLSLAAVGFV